ncbi:prepilin-type N-terminal cleavage/methylation domain-containing protein [Beggiatoa alba B18LD]|uniref:Prepilin-type N-terminal cleavage/methylation domain-containing protein n=1 Tax=Beggiatoa alba B18LD TaxID=395493 RepID=I3CJU2_9GAMM|nr:type IV pilin protein [Beggiatoa alba]EIJ43885.1 prepilin-type N-terminal cleavage/methylation domain-containing protein [Beggiatoa alba B18LD]
MIRRKENGFSMLELMSVVAIIAILVAIAVPTYQSYVEKARRSDAKVSLSEVTQLQETYYADHNAYATTMELLMPNKDTKGFGSKTGKCTVATGVACSKEGYYEIRLTTATATNFVVEAKAPTSGVQAKDTKCTSFTLNATGTKGATGTTSADCW